MVSVSHSTRPSLSNRAAVSGLGLTLHPFDPVEQTGGLPACALPACALPACALPACACSACALPACALLACALPACALLACALPACAYSVSHSTRPTLLNRAAVYGLGFVCTPTYTQFPQCGPEARP
jgi:hypothetical protein